MEEICCTLLDYKCMLIGDSGVGKSSYLMRLLTGEFPTTGNAVKGAVPIKFYTDRGNICLSILEADFNDLLDILYWNNFDCLVVMCDLSKQDHSMIRRLPPVIFDICIPTVVIGNKRDAVDNGLEIEYCHFMPYFEMSVKQNLNIVQPLQWMIRKILQNDQIMFLEEYAPWPPEPLKSNYQPLGKNCKPKLLTDNCDPEALDGKSQPKLSIESIYLEEAFNSPLPEDDGIW